MSALNWDWYDYRIGAHFLSALINGDESGLEDNEAQALTLWERAAHANAQEAGFTVSHWCDVEASENFARCEVTGLRGDVVTVRLMVHKGASNEA